MKISSVVLLPALKPACFFSDDLLRLWLRSIQYDLQHDFAWVTDEANRSVVLVQLQVAFLGKCDDYGLHQRGRTFSSLPDLIADCRESGDYILPSCLGQFCLDVVNFSQLPFLQ